MDVALSLRPIVFLVAICVHSSANADDPGDSKPNWIWSPVHTPGDIPNGACFFRRCFDVNEMSKPTPVSLEVAADDRFDVFVNGQHVGTGEQWKHFTKLDITKVIRAGRNTIAIKVVNQGGGNAGLAARLRVHEQKIVTDQSWKCMTLSLPGWTQNDYTDAGWKSCRILGAWNETAPWIRQPLPSAGQVAIMNSATKPARVELHDPTPDTDIALVAANEETKRIKKRRPGLLQPLTRTLSLLPQARGRERAEKRSDVTASAAKKKLGSIKTTPKLVNPRNEAKPPNRTDSVAKKLAKPAKKDALPTTSTARHERRWTTRNGFTVEQVVSHKSVGSLICATFNEFGQILAGRESGPLLLVSDSDDDGNLDTVRSYCDDVQNCHGILALSGSVFTVAEGPEGTGLYRLHDEDRDGEVDDVTLLAGFDVTASEHGPHGIVLGPDGKLYVSVGNHSRLREPFAATSPRRHLYEGDLVPRYEDPGGHAKGVRGPGGFILRTDINGKKKELFASGLRNTYDLAFDKSGRLFTYDSDMESDMGANWYRPTRLYHVVPGGEFGWRSGWAKWPDYHIDVVPPLAETGRGSPTGMVFYQHNTYPSRFHGAAFLADWSEGQILVASRAEEKRYAIEQRAFLEGKPLNVTDLDIGPDGLLYFSTGGRETQGGIYRVVWNGPKQSQPESSTLESVLTAPQINSSWGRQDVAAKRLKLGPSWNNEITAAVSDSTRPREQRLQGLQLMQWVGPIPSAKLLLELSTDDDAQMRRMAAYLMGAKTNGDVPPRLLEMLSDDHRDVRIQACESLVRSHRSVPFEHVAPLLQSTDRFETWAARRLLELDDPAAWAEAGIASENVRTFLHSSLALMTAWPSKERALTVVSRSLDFLNTYVNDEDFIDLIRLLQVTVLRGDLQPADVPSLAATLADEFPAKEHNIMNRELARLLVRLQVTSIKDRFLDHLDSELPESERIHLAMYGRFLDSAWSTEDKLRLMKHLTPSRSTGSSIPSYLQNVARELAQGFTPAEDGLIIQHGAAVPSAALEAVMRLPESLSSEQIRSVVELDRSLVRTDETTRKLRVAILAILARDGKDVSMAYLRDVFDREPQRRVEATIGLAEQPENNWEYLVRGLPVLDSELTNEILIKLQNIDRSPKKAEPYRQVILAGLRLGDEGGDDAVRLLEHWQGFASTQETPAWKEALNAWQNWYRQTYPGAPSPVLARDSVTTKWDYDKLLAHLGKKNTDEDAVKRGKEVFAAAKCASCHQHGGEGESMGPDLSTIGKRFLAKEILDSILYPSDVISDQYKAKTLVTDDGQAFTGIVGSGGPGELLVLQVDGTKVRVPTKSVEQTIPSQVSAMPEGLLESLTLQQVSDLMEFLKETPDERVGERPQPRAAR